MANTLIRYAARSDKGRVRKNNEDNLFFCGCHLITNDLNRPFSADGECDSPATFGVFDGVGGENCGECASRIAAQTLADFSAQVLSGKTEPERAIRNYVASVNQKIEQVSSLQGTRMATTAAVVFITQSGINAYNIGDSRIYTFRRGRLRQISVDHTLARQKINLSKYSVEEARLSSDWGKLTACLGIPNTHGSFAEIACHPVIPVQGTIRLLLCSDGISDMVPDNVIKSVLRCGSPVNAGKKLMSEALNRGGRDNASFIIVDVIHEQTLFSRLKYSLQIGFSF